MSWSGNLAPYKESYARRFDIPPIVCPVGKGGVDTHIQHPEHELLRLCATYETCVIAGTFCYFLVRPRYCALEKEEKNKCDDA